MPHNLVALSFVLEQIGDEEALLDDSRRNSLVMSPMTEGSQSEKLALHPKEEEKEKGEGKEQQDGEEQSQRQQQRGDVMASSCSRVGSGAEASFVVSSIHHADVDRNIKARVRLSLQDNQDHMTDDHGTGKTCQIELTLIGVALSPVKMTRSCPLPQPEKESPDNSLPTEELLESLHDRRATRTP